MTRHAAKGTYIGNAWADISAFSNHLLHHHNIEDLHGALRLLNLFHSHEKIEIFIVNENFSKVTELKVHEAFLESVHYSASVLSENVRNSIATREILVADSDRESQDISKKSIYIPVISENICIALVNVEGLTLSDDFRMAFKAIASIVTIWIRPHYTKYLRSESTSIAENLAKLTKRQLEIFNLMTTGETNLEIAQQIGFSESLVKSETVQIFQKLEISGRRDPVFQEYSTQSK